MSSLGVKINLGNKIWHEISSQNLHLIELVYWHRFLSATQCHVVNFHSRYLQPSEDSSYLPEDIFTLYLRPSLDSYLPLDFFLVSLHGKHGPALIWSLALVQHDCSRRQVSRMQIMFRFHTPQGRYGDVLLRRCRLSTAPAAHLYCQRPLILTRYDLIYLPSLHACYSILHLNLSHIHNLYVNWK